MRHAANLITISRILLSPVLLLALRNPPLFSLLYLACGLTDVLDGHVARKTGGCTDLGARLDSIADLLLFAAIIVSLVSWLGQKAFTFLPSVLAIILIRCVNIILVACKHHTFAILHTWGNKLTGALLFAAPLLVLYRQTAFLWAVCLCGLLSALEETIIHLTSAKLDVNRRSLRDCSKSPL